MAISHLCLQCSLDLARVRPQTDPHYGLPLVICPRCATAVVRRRHPVQRQWRRFLRLTHALNVLGLQLLLLGVLLALITTVAVHFDEELAHGGFNRIDSVVLLYPFLLLPIALGTWLTAGLPHWSRVKAWLAFAALAAALTSFDTIIGPALERVAIFIGMDDVRSHHIEASTWGWRVAVIAILMIAALPGIICGRGLRAGIAQSRSSRWRRRRRRLRLRRATE